MSRIALPNLRIGGLRQFSFGDVIYDRANLYPNLDLDFATNKNLTDNKSGKTSIVSFSRSAASSPGTYVGSDGLIHGAPVNLWLYSEDLVSAGVLAGNGATIGSQNSAVAPDGKQTADGASVNGGNVYKALSGIDNVNVTFSFWVKGVSGETIKIQFYDYGTLTFKGTTTIVLNGAWQRVSTSAFIVGKATGFDCLAYFADNRAGGGTATNVHFWGAQLEETDPALMGPSAYIKTTSQTLCAPRFDHEPTSGNLTTNLLLYSEMFDNTSVWLGATANVSANQIASPFGDLVADKIIPTSGANLGFQGDVYQQIQKQAQAIQYTTSVYAKAAEFTRLKIQVQDSGANGSANVTIDLDDGSVVSAASSGGTFSGASSSVETLSDGWYRVSLTFTTGAESNVRIRIFANETGVSGDASSGIYVFGAQLEASSSAGTYVRTLGETRSISDATAESLGLLVEEQRTNNLLYSEDFSNVYWAKGGSGTFTYNAESAPDGTQTAMRMTDTRYIAKTGFSITAGTTYTTSIFVKDDGAGSIRLYSQIETGGYVSVDIDTANWTVISNGFTNSPVITDFGNGWHRISLTETAAVTGSKVVSYWDVGVAGSGAVLLWGAQLEVGSFVSSYITTTTSTQTRYADIAAIQDEDFSVTNLLSYSESFDVDWVPADVTIQANAAQSPDGQMTADLVYPTSTGTTRYIRQDGAATSTSTRLSLSVYAKASGKDKLFLYMLSTGTHGVAYFDLADQSTSVVGGGSSTPTATIEDVGNGWYRCTYIIGTSITMLSAYYSGFGPVDAKGSLNVTANGTDGVLFWGAQLTATSYPVDYVSTRNLLTDSQDFERSAWVKSATELDNDVAISPDGTRSADKLRDTLPSLFHRIYQLESGTFNGAHTVSFYVKAQEINSVSIRAINNASANYSTFDLSTETITNSGVLPDSATITAVGDGWYRITRTDTLSSAAVRIAYLELYNGGTVYPGDNTSGVLIWGAQLEPGTTATEYYRTYDVVGKNYNWYEPTEGTTYFEGKSPLLSSFTNPRFVVFNDGSGNNVIESYITQNSSVSVSSALRVVVGGVSQALITRTGTNADQFRSVAAGFKQDDFAVTTEGNAVTTDSSGTIPVVSELEIGALLGTNVVNGHIKRIIYFPRRIKNSNLVLMTE